MQSRPPMQNYAILVLGCVVLALCFARPSTGEGRASSTGRYQMVVGPNDTNDAIYVMDVHSGECWFRQHLGLTEWTPLGSPANKKQATNTQDSKKVVSPAVDVDVKHVK